MAQDYIEISTTGNISGAKKYFIMPSSNNVDGYETATEVTTTLNGDTVISFGIGKQIWDFDVQVGYTATASGYGTLADIKALFTVNTALTLVIRDQSSTIYSALLTNKGMYQPKPVGVRWYDADSKWRVNIKLKQA